MSKIEWKTTRGSGHKIGRNSAYLGDVFIAHLAPHEFNPEAWSLNVHLPGCNGQALTQYDDPEQARTYMEKVVLPEWLKKAGLQPKPAPKKTAKKEN